MVSKQSCSQQTDQQNKCNAISESGTLSSVRFQVVDGFLLDMTMVPIPSLLHFYNERHTLDTPSFSLWQWTSSGISCENRSRDKQKWMDERFGWDLRIVVWSQATTITNLFETEHFCAFRCHLSATGRCNGHCRSSGQSLELAGRCPMMAAIHNVWIAGNGMAPNEYHLTLSIAGRWNGPLWHLLGSTDLDHLKMSISRQECDRVEEGRWNA